MSLALPLCTVSQLANLSAGDFRYCHFTQLNPDSLFPFDTLAIFSLPDLGGFSAEIR